MALFQDNFNRADSTDNLGSNWTDCIGVGLGIISNAAYNAAATSSRGGFVTGTTQTANQYAQVVFSGGVTTGVYFSLLLRGSGADGTRNTYQFTIGGTNELYITRVTAGSGTDIATGSFSFSNGDLFRAEVEGTALRLLINGTVRLSTTDANFASGLTGLEMYREGFGTPRYEDFEAGDIGGVGIPLAWLTA